MYHCNIYCMISWYMIDFWHVKIQTSDLWLTFRKGFEYLAMMSLERPLICRWIRWNWTIHRDWSSWWPESTTYDNLSVSICILDQSTLYIHKSLVYGVSVSNKFSTVSKQIKIKETRLQNNTRMDHEARGRG